MGGPRAWPGRRVGKCILVPSHLSTLTSRTHPAREAQAVTPRSARRDQRTANAAARPAGRGRRVGGFFFPPSKGKKENLLNPLLSQNF